MDDHIDDFVRSEQLGGRDSSYSSSIQRRIEPAEGGPSDGSTSPNFSSIRNNPSQSINEPTIGAAGVAATPAPGIGPRLAGHSGSATRAVPHPSIWSETERQSGGTLSQTIVWNPDGTTLSVAIDPEREKLCKERAGAPLLYTFFYFFSSVFFLLAPVIDPPCPFHFSILTYLMSY
jgi:hypothetical protein